MKTNTYKLFNDRNDDFKIELVKMNTNEIGYYDFIEEQSKQGKDQFLLTSKLMIKLILEVLRDEDNFVNDICLYDTEDTAAHDRIMNILDQYRNNNITEQDLHDFLFFLENDYSVDLASVEYSNIDKGNFSVQSNGVCVGFGNEDYWSAKIVDCLEKAWS